MDSTVNQLVNIIPDPGMKQSLGVALRALADGLSSRMTNTAGLVIKAGASALVKSGAADAYASVNGKLVKITAATDMSALVGTVATATFNVFAYFIDSSGTKTTVMGTAGASLATVKFPSTPVQNAMIGYTIINPTGTGSFVGGTTAIDDATVVPNAVHVSVLGGFDPNFLTGA